MIRNSVDLWIQDVDGGRRDEPDGVTTRTTTSNETHPIIDIIPDNGGYEQGELNEGAAVPDWVILMELCSEAHAAIDTTEEAIFDADRRWDPVREWMRTHTADEVHTAVRQRDEFGKTALHVACQNAPPDDVIDVFLTVAKDVVLWRDSYGLLPIHYACAHSSSIHVVKALTTSFPESKTAVDTQGRTPLHCAWGPSNVQSADVIQILASSGAAAYPDSNGMLPLHYACAYGAAEDCLFVLTDAYPAGMKHLDKMGRIPLHFSLSNAGRPGASSAVRLLVSLDRNLANPGQGSLSPVKILAEYAATVPKQEKAQRASCKACLNHILAARPTPSADFFTALQALPPFLQEVAVVTKGVQELLNFKISQRFCTLILMLDFYVQMMVVAFYWLAIVEAVNIRFQETTEDIPALSKRLLYPLYVGATYFLCREVVNLLSLLSLGALRSWAREPSTLLNVLYIFALFFWTIHMDRGSLAKEFFRFGVAMSILLIWAKFVGYLRNMLIDFAVFTGGVFHVIRRLAAFLVCLTIILVAFSRMFFTLFRQSDYCRGDNPANDWTEESVLNDLRSDKLAIHAWCDSWDSFLKVFTFLLGDIDGTLFDDNPVALALFVFFVFLVVILLANVLIAIVADSYKIIQDQRSAIVFWTNRLNYIAQMDAIANGPWKRLMYEGLGMKQPVKKFGSSETTKIFGKDQWDALMHFIEAEIEGTVFVVGYLAVVLLRIFVLVCVIPAWVVLGICTAGWLWPPQIREYVLTSAVSRHNSESEKEEELRSTQLVKMKAEIVALGEELRQELALDRAQVIQTKSLMAQRKAEIEGEMKNVKRLLVMLFEDQAPG